jgi:hypothetical protein
MRQRRPEVVSDPVASTFHFAHQPFNFIKHMIDKVYKQVNLITSADRKALMKIALRYSTDHLPYRSNPAHLSHAQHQSANNANREGEKSPANHRTDDCLANLENMGQVAGDYQLGPILAPFAHHAKNRHTLIFHNSQRMLPRATSPVWRKIAR